MDFDPGPNDPQAILKEPTPTNLGIRGDWVSPPPNLLHGFDRIRLEALPGSRPRPWDVVLNAWSSVSLGLFVWRDPFLGVVGVVGFPKGQLSSFRGFERKPRKNQLLPCFFGGWFEGSLKFGHTNLRAE